MNNPSAGYSGTPLGKKLGYRPGMRAVVRGAPANYVRMIDTPGVQFHSGAACELDLVHLFVSKRAALETLLKQWMKRITPDGMIWVSWPKKTSGVVSDMTEQAIRDAALPLGLVDVKVCAI